MKRWIRLLPRADKPRRPRAPDRLRPTPPPDREGPMQWRIDPASPAAEALRDLRRKLALTPEERDESDFGA